MAKDPQMHRSVLMSFIQLTVNPFIGSAKSVEFIVKPVLNISGNTIILLDSVRLICHCMRNKFWLQFSQTKSV